MESSTSILGLRKMRKGFFGVLVVIGRDAWLTPDILSAPSIKGMIGLHKIAILCVQFLPWTRNVSGWNLQTNVNTFSSWTTLLVVQMPTTWWQSGKKSRILPKTRISTWNILMDITWFVSKHETTNRQPRLPVNAPPMIGPMAGPIFLAIKKRKFGSYRPFHTIGQIPKMPKNPPLSERVDISPMTPAPEKIIGDSVFEGI